MPSDLPSLRIRTDEETYHKIKAIAEYNKRSYSKEIERLILKHIWEFEQNVCPINVGMMNTKEIVEDIKKRIAKNPPYGDNVKE